MFSSRHLEFLHLYIFYKCTYTDVWVLGNNGNFMIGTYIHPFIIFNWINIVQIVQTQMEFLLQKYFSTFLYFEVKLEFYQSCTYQQNEQNKFGGIISHGRRDKVLYYTNLHLRLKYTASRSLSKEKYSITFCYKVEWYTVTQSHY